MRKCNIIKAQEEKCMKVLSLFDGISCSMVALQRAGIKVENVL